MARVALPMHEQITDPAVEGIFAWVTEMEGSVPNHFYVELNFPEFFTAKLGATKVLWEMGELTMEEIQLFHAIYREGMTARQATLAWPPASKSLQKTGQIQWPATTAPKTQPSDHRH